MAGMMDDQNMQPRGLGGNPHQPPANPQNSNDDSGQEQQPNVSPEEQAQYDQFVKNAYSVMYDSKVLPQIAQSLKTNDPIDALAHAVVMVIARTEESAKQSGQEISDDVLLQGGKEILEDLADYAGEAKIHDYTPKEMEAATLRAMDLYREMAVKSGKINPDDLKQQFGELVQADKAGNVDAVVPGLSAAARQMAANDNQENQ